MSWDPPSFSLEELRDRVDQIADATEPRPLLEDLLPSPLTPVPGRGWLVVTGYEASGVIAVSTLAPGPALDRLLPDLALLHRRIFFDGADLTRAQAAAAARVEASFARESVAALRESYPHADDAAALAAIHGSAELLGGVPEVCLGITAWVKCAG